MSSVMILIIDIYKLCEELYKLGDQIETIYKIKKIDQLELLRMLNKDNKFECDMNIIVDMIRV